MIWTLIMILLHWNRINLAHEINSNEKIASQLSRLFEGKNESSSIVIKAVPTQETEAETRLENATKKVESGFDNATKKFEPRAVCDCGIQQYVPQRVFGGTDAYPNEYPWMIAIVFPPGTVTCGASLISDRFALSAAHCFLFPANSIYAILAAYDLRLIGPETPIVPVRQVVINPMFNRTTGDYDLALVEFAYQIRYTPNISPICLPFPNVDLTWQPVVVMGWGLTHFSYISYTLQEATLSVVPNNLCQDQFGPSNPITERMICAWGHGKDACRGDSGGPLIWNSEGRWYIVGVVSFGMQCGPTSTTAGVYTRVDRFLQWIVSETENGACLAPAITQPTPVYPWLVTSQTSTSSAQVSGQTGAASTGRSAGTTGRSAGTTGRAAGTTARAGATTRRAFAPRAAHFKDIDDLK